MRNLVPLVQFKKQEKHPWRSVTFNKVAGSHSSMGVFHIFKIVQMLPNRTTASHIQSIQQSQTKSTLLPILVKKQ